MEKTIDIELQLPRDYFELDMVYGDGGSSSHDKLISNGYFSHIFMLVFYAIAFILTAVGLIKFFQLKKSI